MRMHCFLKDLFLTSAAASTSMLLQGAENGVIWHRVANATRSSSSFAGWHSSLEKLRRKGSLLCIYRDSRRRANCCFGVSCGFESSPLECVLPACLHFDPEREIISDMSLLLAWSTDPWVLIRLSEDRADSADRAESILMNSMSSLSSFFFSVVQHLWVRVLRNQDSINSIVCDSRRQAFDECLHLHCCCSGSTTQLMPRHNPL